MLVHRVNKDRNLPLLILQLRVDPHGEYVCLLDQRKRLLMVQVLTIMRYFQIYRLHFKKTKEYSFHEQIPWAFQLEPSMKEQLIYDISLSERQNQSQHLLFVYLKNIEIVTLSIHNKAITKRHLYTLPYEIIYTNIVGTTVYIAMYNLTQATINFQTMELKTEEKKIKLSQSTPQTKDTLRRKEIMRYFQQNGDCPRIWQSAGGMLMKGNQILAYEFIEHLDLSNSLQELQYREVKDYAPIKYQLSACKYYLMGADNIVNPSQQVGLFIIRSKLTNWSQICELSSKPEINPYWTFYYKYDKEAKLGLKSKKNDRKDINCDRLLIATYISKQQEIVISWIVVDLLAKKKLIAGEGKDDADRVRYSSILKQIISLKNIKHEVIQIKWVGLTQFMYLERNGQLYFVQFQGQYLAY